MGYCILKFICLRVHTEHAFDSYALKTEEDRRTVGLVAGRHMKVSTWTGGAGGKSLRFCYEW